MCNTIVLRCSKLIAAGWMALALSASSLPRVERLVPGADTATILGYELVDHYHNRFALGDFAGKYLLVNFVFTDCLMYCSAQTTQLGQAYLDMLERFPAEEFHFVSISLTPLDDNPAELMEFAHRFDAVKPNWHFSIGSALATRNLIDALGVTVKRYDELVLHTPDIFLFDRDGYYFGRRVGLPVDSAEIVSTFSGTGGRLL